MHPAGDEERRVPALVGVLNQREVVADAVQPHSQQPNAAPGVNKVAVRAFLAPKVVVTAFIAHCREGGEIWIC